MVDGIGRGTTNAADQLRRRFGSAKDKPIESQQEVCRSIAQAAMKDFGQLPATRSFELYLVQGVFIPLGGDPKDARVIFPPEFVFTLDVGLESLVGIIAYWNTVGMGDPAFPDFSDHAVRSIPSRDISDIIYPIVAGTIMVGAREGASDAEVRQGLEGAGLHNVQGSSGFWTAECQPFVERSVCKKLEFDLAFVKYAEPNRIVRLIDFGPGWSCVRLT